MREHIVPQPWVCKKRIKNLNEHFVKFDFKRMLPLTMRDSYVTVARQWVELKTKLILMCFAK